MPSRRLAALVAALVTALAGAAAGQSHAASPTKTHRLAPPTRGVVVVNTNLALENGSAAGTGIVLTKDGEVLTNNHVIRGATTIKVVVPATHKTYPASVVGYDIKDDVALLKLQGATNLATATTGNSAKVRVGQGTRAVGNANGGGKLVMTSGRILALHQTISVQGDDGSVSPLANLIETSARLVPGDSGGPLLDPAGRVIGVDAAGSPVSTFGGTAPGYAIGINRALAVVKQIAALRASTDVHIGDTAFIGIEVQDSPSGIAVGPLVPGSPAEQVGLQQGDVITSLDGTSVTTIAGLRTALFVKHPGDTITLGYTDPIGNAASASIVLASGPPQ